MRAEVKVKHGSSSAILTATASAAIPPGGPVAPATTFIGHASASFTFNVLSTAPVGGTATVTINGTYATTPFTCQVTATVVAATHHDEGDDEGNGDNQGNGGHED